MSKICRHNDNSIDPDQAAPVYPDLSVLKLTIIMGSI